MVHVRWTVALIIIGIPILVSAFRVRLAHERSDSQKQSDSRDVNELDFDQKQSRLSNKHLHVGLKADVQEKLKIDGKLSADDLSYLHGLSDNKKLNGKIISKTKLTDKKEHSTKKVYSNELNLIVKSTLKKDNYGNDKDDDDDDNDYDDVNLADSKIKTSSNKLYGTEVNDDNSNFDIEYNDKNDENDDSDEDDDKIAIQITKVLPNIKHDPVTSIKRPSPELIKNEKVIFEEKKKEYSKDQSKGNRIEISERKQPVPEIKKSHPNKTNIEESNEDVLSKAKDQKTKKEVDTTKESKSVDLDKIKVKSHLEAGKLQSHVISKDEDNIEVKVEQSESDVKPKNKIRDHKIKPSTDTSHKNILLQSEFQDFYGFFPTFAPNFSRVHNPECRRHGQILLRQLRGSKLWALNMLDSSAKIPSGLLQGNGIQLGDFDQCLASHARVQLETGSIVKLQGKYCLVRIDVKAEHADMEIPIDLIQARNLIKGRVNDPGHFVPRFSTLSWGLCVPSTCNPDDVEAMVKESTKRYQKLGVSFDIEADEVDCHLQGKGNWWDEWMEIPTLLTLSFYGVFICIVIIATCQDLLGEKNAEDQDNLKEDNNKEENIDDKKNTNGFLSGFSLVRTVKKLLAPAGTEEIASIHGLRAAATVALIIAHKFLPVAHTPYTNRVKVAETVSSSLWSWCRVGWVFTDCFFLLSGALTAYRTSDKTSSFNRLASKYIRQTPAMLAVIWFYTFIWDHISVGPLWGSLVTKNVDVCREKWWWNLFYLQNYFGLENMCAPQTHQLALDLQLSFVGSFIVWAINSEIVGAKLFMPMIHLYAAYSRYATFSDHRLTMIAYHGVSVSQLYRTGRMSYTSILHRSTSYLIGISLGLALRTRAQHGKFLIFIGWVVSTGLLGAVLWAGSDSGYFNYQYNLTFAAQYAALAPIATGLAFAWLLYAAHNGYCEFLASLLCSRPLLLISRLSYALYLTQFIVFLTNAATTRTSTDFTLLSMVDVQEITAIFLTGLVLTLTLVIPIQSLPNILFRVNKNTDQENESQNETNKEDNVPKVEEKPQIRKTLIAHRELLEEIPEVEVEYETQQDTQNLEEIFEDDEREDEDLEIIEEEEEPEGGEDFWANDVNGHHDLEEWEWSNGNRGSAQYYRYSR